MLKGIIQYAHQLMEDAVKPNETVIDATCGNGHDTLFLSEHVGEAGHVFAFDIQDQAIDNTTASLANAGRTNVSVIQDSHAHVAHYLDQAGVTEIGGAIFNLGYLPKSDKAIITKGATTIAAVSTMLAYLKKSGLVVLVIYHGHEGGKSEKEIVLDYVTRLDQKEYAVIQYGFINQKNNPPFVIAIEKR